MGGNVIAEGLELPEGPAFDAKGNLYVVEIRGGQISKIEPGGERSVFARTGGGPTGSAFGFDGNLYVCNNGGMSHSPEGTTTGLAPSKQGGWIERCTPDGSVEVLYTHYEGSALEFPNDLVFDETGSFYFTDSRVGSWRDRPLGEVYWASPDGDSIRCVSEGYNLPNGIGITPDGKTLVVAESVTRKLWSCEIIAPGELGPRQELAELPNPYIPDGFCFDSEGYLLCAGVHGGGLICFDPSGGLTERIEFEGSRVTNVCFGGESFDTLYATEAELGQVVAVPWRRPGLRLYPDQK